MDDALAHQRLNDELFTEREADWGYPLAISHILRS